MSHINRHSTSLPDARLPNLALLDQGPRSARPARPLAPGHAAQAPVPVAAAGRTNRAMDKSDSAPDYQTVRLLVPAVLAAALLCAGCDPPARLVAAGPVFYAVMPFRDDAVQAVSAGTGAVLRRVADAHRGGMDVAGISAAGPGALLVTYSRGPRCTSGILGCGPAPHTCGAEVVRVPLDGAPPQVVWQVGADELLSSAALSPDGMTIAANGAPCVPSYFNRHLVMRRMQDGATWTVGAGLARCHNLGAPAWLDDSKHVVVAYAAPPDTPYGGPDGSCSVTGDSALTVVDVTRQQDGLDGASRTPSASCTWQSTAAATDVVWAVEACGPDDSRLLGPASLVELSPSLKVGRRWPIGDCTAGNSLAANDTHDVLIAAYLFCNPPLHGGPVGDPITVLQRLRDGRLDQYASAPGGATYWDQLAW